MRPENPNNELKYAKIPHRDAESGNDSLGGFVTH